MRTTTIRLAGALAAFGLLAAACGGGDESSETAASPLAEFLGQDLDFESAEGQARLQQQSRERQEKIAACMRAEGFEYLPVEDSDFNFVESDDGLAYDSREYAEKWGFGFSTQRFTQAEVGPDLIGRTEDVRVEEELSNDPNQAIVEAMDEATQEAYYAALYGSQDQFDGFDPETMTDEELESFEEELSLQGPQGCQGAAFEEDFNNAFFQEFDKELQELYEAVQDDPRIVEAQAEATTCMAEKGLEVGSGDDFFTAAFEEIDQDMSKIESTLNFPGEDLTEEDFASMSEGELEQMFNTPVELSAEAKAILAEVQEKEIELAVGMFDCGGGFTGNQDLYQEVQAEYEQRFLDQNADRLADYEADE